MSNSDKPHTEATGSERIAPYEATADKTAQVRRMFDSIAPAYDLMNTLMTFGLHRVWLKGALRRVAPALRGSRVLDIATGTGDVALRMAHHCGVSSVVGVDLSEGMLVVARRKLEARLTEVPVSFVCADSLALPMAEGEFDVITVAYGVRNFNRLAEGYAEMLRVLRPGGTLCVIELCEPSNPLMRWGYKLYSRHIIPLVGRLVSGDGRAYTYLPESIAACPQRREMTALMAAAGFEQCDYHTFFPGTVAVYTARKPMHN